MRKHLCLIMTILLLAACNSESDSTQTLAAEDISQYAFTVIAQGDDSAYSEQDGLELDSEKLIILKTQTELDEFWALHTANHASAGSAPEVNFDHEMLLVLISPQCRSGGYSLSVTNIYTYEEEIILEVVRTEPGADCAVTDEITQPFVIVKTERSNLPVLFSISTQTVCE